MADYQKMYGILCRAMSEALDRLPQKAENLPARLCMEKALNEAEDLYIETAEEEECFS